MGPGDGSVAAHMGGGSFRWSNWCAGTGHLEARIEVILDGLHASTTLPITRLPVCTVPGAPSTLTPPAG
jgi:hypothetical protein